ncbi:type II secretion system secretin GspD [Sessilibacter corallicola]|uniref:type II secretion system secretin GspD n=1 Tax=Sessilibacter corallicola TaxID=2904075 RepID=UPI001E48E0E4|nr:type II secretion system secretin GspD [Sessilibacter corallicola]
MRRFLLAALLLCASYGNAQSTEPEKLTLSFNDADIVEVIRFVAEQTDKTVIIDPRVKGKVQVFTNGEVTRDQAYALLLSILELHGFTAYENGDVVRVVPNKEVRSSPIPVMKDVPSQAGDEYITEVVTLKNVSAAKILPVLRPLVAQHAHMAAYDPSNSIVISDTYANITRVKQVISQIDGAAVAQTEIIQLEFAPVTEAIRMLQQLLSGDAANDTGTLKMIADVRTNSMLLSGDQLQRTRVKDLVARIDRPQAQTGNVRVIYLEYANATEVAQTLQQLLQNLQQGGGGGAEGGSNPTSSVRPSVEADESTNALLITAEGDTLDSLLQVVERLDIRRAQVLVEAVIAELEDVDGKDLGIQWLFASEDGGFGANSLGDGVLAGAGSIALSDDDDVIEDLAGAIGTITGTTFGIGDFDGDKGFLALVNALNEKTNSNILSTPSVLTTDNHEAEISVGQEVPFVTGSFTSTEGNVNNPFQTIERQNVGITLRVTPQINEGDKIVLDIEQEVSSLTGETSASDVITNERSITTQVLASDGQIVVLGGLMRDNVQTFQSRVPVLGSIPLVGRLFRSNSDRVTKTNLLVFIRATVIRDDETLTGTTAEKYRFIREQQLKARRQKGLSLKKDLLPVVPEWPIAADQDLSGYETIADQLEAERLKKEKK